MRVSRQLIASSVALVAVAGVTSIGIARPTADRARAAEVARIRTHFDSVLAELPARDVSALSREQAVHRSILLEELRSYRNRGVFPHNYDFPGQAVPYFVDRNTGTLCAVAHLLALTGRRDIVDRVARANNNVLVPQLAGDAAFTGWLDANGLTLSEAAFIQVPYNAGPSQTEVAAMTAGAVAGSLVIGTTAITGLVNAFANGDGHRTRMSKVGMVSGALTTAFGMGMMAQGAQRELGGSMMAVGATSLALALRARHSRTSFLANRDAERARAIAQTSLAPIISTSNGGRAGVAVSMRF